MNDLKLSGKRKVIFIYSTEHLEKKDKVRFFYALNGRTGDGMLKSTGSTHVGRGVLMTATSNAEEFREFFRLWGCEIKLLNVEVEE